jgi:hypothetical protein
VFCDWVVIGSWVPRNQGVIFLLVALFAAPSIGGIWMIHSNTERIPSLPFVALAFCVSFSFLWYYAKRYRTGKCFTRSASTLINAVHVDFQVSDRRLHIQVTSRWLILLGLLCILDTNEANLEGRVECQHRR